MLKILLMVSIYMALCLYVLLQTLFYSYRIIGPGRKNPKAGKASKGNRMNLLMVIEAIVFCLFSFVPLFGTFLPYMPAKYEIMKWGNVWFGFLAFYGGFLFVAHMLRLILRQRRISKISVARNAAILISCIVFAIGVNVYGSIHALNTEAIQYDVNLTNNLAEDQTAQNAEESSSGDSSSDKKTDESDDSDEQTAADSESASGDTKTDDAGFSTSGKIRVVLAADLHMSVNSKPEAIKNMVDRINEQNADVVVIAGDFFTSNYDGLEEPQKYINELKRIESKYGVYAVYGNHDLTENLFFGFSVSPVSEAFRDERMTEFLEEAGIKMLEDEVIELPGGLQIAGRKDGDKVGDGTANRLSEKELLAMCDHSKPILVLEHEPDEYEQLSEAGADIVVSGHTHDGQVFPGNVLASILDENSFGKKKLYGMQTVVTAGVGFFGPPMRVGTNSDVSVIDIEF